MKLTALYGILMSFLLAACGGVQREAKIATAIQTLMSNAMTSFASKSSDTLAVHYSCGTVVSDGTMDYTLPDTASLASDPARLIEFIRNNPSGISMNNVVFNNCVVKACGESMVLNGPAALKLDVQPQVLLAATSPTDIPAKFELTVSDLPATGLINGTISFSYIIEATYTKDSLGSVTIQDTTTPNPLLDKGKTYLAKDISALTDGC